MEDFSFDKVKENGTVIYQVYGKLIDTDDIETFTNDAKKEIKDGNVKIIICLEKLNFLNSSGLNGLINILTKSRNNEGDTIICSLSENIQKLFLITKLNTVFTIADSKKEAIEKINK